MSHHADTVRRLLDQAGQTYAAEAGIRLADRSAPLYQLLVLSVLLSTRIKAGLAVSATRSLIDAGMSSADRMRDASWQERVDALGRAHYRRYDESHASALGDGAVLALDEYHGDLRRLRERADGEPDRIRTLLTEFPRLGPVGAEIFAREVQAVWPELRPTLDGKARDGARRLGLPERTDELAGLVADEQLAVLAAALVRVALSKPLAERVRAG